MKLMDEKIDKVRPVLVQAYGTKDAVKFEVKVTQNNRGRESVSSFSRHLIVVESCPLNGAENEKGLNEMCGLFWGHGRGFGRYCLSSSSVFEGVLEDLLHGLFGAVQLWRWMGMVRCTSSIREAVRKWR